MSWVELTWSGLTGGLGLSTLGLNLATTKKKQREDEGFSVHHLEKDWSSKTNGPNNLKLSWPSIPELERSLADSSGNEFRWLEREEMVHAVMFFWLQTNLYPLLSSSMVGYMMVKAFLCLLMISAKRSNGVGMWWFFSGICPCKDEGVFPHKLQRMII